MDFKLPQWLIVVTLAFFAVSCDSDIADTAELQMPDTPSTYTGYNSSFKVEDEMLSFSTMSDFQGFTRQMTQNGTANEIYFDDLITRVTTTSSFASLYPHQELEKMEQDQIDAYMAALEQRVKQVQEVYNTTLSEDNHEFADFIADPSFAALLNIDGDIKIAGATYHYTPFGLFITSKEEGETGFRSLMADSDRIRSTINNHSSSKGVAVSISDGFEFFVANQPDFLLNPDGKQPINQKDLDESRLAMCGGGNSSTLWNSAFGPSVDCSDYFTDKRRIKTKIFDQNYLIFASLGTNVRSQGRSFGTWWVRNVDELELGTGFFNYDFVVPSPPMPNLNPFGNSILAARYADGTIIGFNGQVLNSGPIFDKAKSIAANLPFIPIVDEDWVQLRVFADFGPININTVFSAADFLDFRELVDDYIEDQVPALMRRAGRVVNQVELVSVTDRTMQVAADVLDRNRRNLANMKHYFAVNTAQLGISGNPSIPGGLGVDFTNIFNAYDY